MTKDEDEAAPSPPKQNRRMTPGWKEGPRPPIAEPPARPRPDNDIRGRKAKKPS